jgi:hypothetical protein
MARAAVSQPNGSLGGLKVSGTGGVASLDVASSLGASSVLSGGEADDQAVAALADDGVEHALTSLVASVYSV